MSKTDTEPSCSPTARREGWSGAGIDGKEDWSVAQGPLPKWRMKTCGTCIFFDPGERLALPKNKKMNARPKNEESRKTFLFSSPFDWKEDGGRMGSTHTNP